MSFFEESMPMYSLSLELPIEPAPQPGQRQSSRKTFIPRNIIIPAAIKVPTNADLMRPSAQIKPITETIKSAQEKPEQNEASLIFFFSTKSSFFIVLSLILKNAPNRYGSYNHRTADKRKHPRNFTVKHGNPNRVQKRFGNGNKRTRKRRAVL